MTFSLALLAGILLTASPAAPPVTTAGSTATPAKKKPATQPTAPAPAPTPAAAPLPPPSAPTLGKEIRTIPLSEGQARRVHIVRTAPSYPCTIEFPEAFTAPPACGDCGDKAGLFRLDVFNDSHYLVIKPRLFAGPQTDGSNIPASDFLTTLTVRLQSYTLTIQVEYVDDTSKADPRVVFTVPERSNETVYVQKELAKARKQLEEDFAAKLERGVTAGLLRSMSEAHSCTALGQRARKDDLVIEAKELCTFGQRYFLRFNVENRARGSVDLAEASVTFGASKKTLVGSDTTQHFLTSDHLEWKQSATGIVGFQLDESQQPPRVFEITVTERGGLGRTITLADIEI